MLIAPKQVAGVDLIRHIVQTGVVTIGYDGLGNRLELVQISDHTAAKERGAGWQRWFVDHHRGALGLDAFHHALNGGVAEIVGVGFHRHSVDADDDFLFPFCVPAAVCLIRAGKLQHPVGNKVLSCAVGFHDGRHHILRNILEIGQKLLGVLGQAVAAVAEGGVIVVRADTGVEAYAIDDLLRIEPLGLGIGVQFIKIGDAQRKIGVCKELVRPLPP